MNIRKVFRRVHSPLPLVVLYLANHFIDLNLTSNPSFNEEMVKALLLKYDRISGLLLAE